MTTIPTGKGPQSVNPDQTTITAPLKTALTSSTRTFHPQNQIEISEALNQNHSGTIYQKTFIYDDKNSRDGGGLPLSSEFVIGQATVSKPATSDKKSKIKR